MRLSVTCGSVFVSSLSLLRTASGYNHSRSDFHPDVCLTAARVLAVLFPDKVHHCFIHTGTKELSDSKTPISSRKGLVTGSFRFLTVGLKGFQGHVSPPPQLIKLMNSGLRRYLQSSPKSINPINRRKKKKTLVSIQGKILSFLRGIQTLDFQLLFRSLVMSPKKYYGSNIGAQALTEQSTLTVKAREPEREKITITIIQSSYSFWL